MRNSKQAETIAAEQSWSALPSCLAAATILSSYGAQPEGNSSQPEVDSSQCEVDGSQPAVVLLASILCFYGAQPEGNSRARTAPASSSEALLQTQGHHFAESCSFAHEHHHSASRQARSISNTDPVVAAPTLPSGRCRINLSRKVAAPTSTGPWSMDWVVCQSASTLLSNCHWQ